MKAINQKAWLLILPVVLCVAFSAILPLMTVVNYSVQDILGPDQRVSTDGRLLDAANPHWTSVWRTTRDDGSPFIMRDNEKFLSGRKLVPGSRPF